MKFLATLVLLTLPAMGFAKSYQCHVENVIVKYKTTSDTLTAEFFLDKKLVNSCLFNALANPGSRAGVANSVTQNYEKVSCSDETVKLGVGMGVSSRVYTKTSVKRDTAFFFVFKGLDPVDCVAVN